MTDPKAKLQEEIERRAIMHTNNLQHYKENASDAGPLCYDNVYGAFEAGAAAMQELIEQDAGFWGRTCSRLSGKLELMQAREARLVAALRSVQSELLNFEVVPAAYNNVDEILKELGLAEGGESGEG